MNSGMLDTFLRKAQELSNSWSALFNDYLAIFHSYPTLKAAAIVAIPLIIMGIVKISQFLLVKVCRPEKYDISEKLIHRSFHFLFLFISQTALQSVLSLLNASTDVFEFLICAIGLGLISSYIFKFLFDLLIDNLYDQFHHLISAKDKASRAIFINSRKIIQFYVAILYVLLAYEIPVLIPGVILYIYLSVKALKLRHHFDPIIRRIIPPQAIEKIEEFDNLVVPIIIAFPSILFLIIYAFFQKLILGLAFLGPIKKVAAVIIQQQASESHSDGTSLVPANELPENLKTEFETVLNASPPKQILELREKLEREIIGWASGSSEDASIALIGHPGSGQTEFIEEILGRQTTCKVIRWKISTRIVTVEGLKTEMQQVIQSSLGITEVSIQKFLENYPEKLIISIENAHKLFLNCPGGFKAYTRLIDLCNIASPNIFWIVNFEHQPWCFLRSFYKGNLVFKRSLIIPDFTEGDIQSIVLKKLSRIGLTLKFERDLYQLTAQKGNDSKIENVQMHYFRILTEHAHGNPKLALNLLMQSIVNIDSKSITVQLPRTSNLAKVKVLQPSLYFVLGQIYRHQDLTFEECQSVTDYDFRTILTSLRSASDHKVIFKDKMGRYSIDLYWYFQLKQFMHSRNFIYE